MQLVVGSAHCNLVYAEGMRWEPFTGGKQIPVCQSLRVYKRRGRRGNVALFCNTLRGNWGFQHVARSAHCSFVVRRWHCEIGHFPMQSSPWLPSDRLLLAQMVSGQHCILRVDWRLQRSVVSAHLLLDACDAFPTHGNTHLPQWATVPLWHSPSGHFFPSLHFIYPFWSGYIRVDTPFWIECQIHCSPWLS